MCDDKAKQEERERKEKKTDRFLIRQTKYKSDVTVVLNNHTK
jgi:hypothetical protein